MNFADNLKKIRKDNNLSQEQLAEKLGISRQAVSKWESGQSYPEMDKVIQICQMFDVNMDELINDEIDKDNNKKENSMGSKYIKSFFDYLTRVVDMFSNMKFKQIILCFIEQCIIGLIIFMIFGIIGAIGSSLVNNTFGFLPSTIYSLIYCVLESIYILVSLLIGIIIFFYIFKIRYLDYYEMVDLPKEELADKDNDKNEEIITNKKEKVIIRDPKHSEFSFIGGLAKIILWFIKFTLSFVVLGFGLVILCCVVFFVMSFMIIKTGLLFLGLELFIISCIVGFSIVTDLLFSFIFDKRFNKLIIFILFISSFVVGGIGLGLCTVSIKDFDVIEDSSYMVKDTYTYEMTDDLYFNNFHVEYIEKEIPNVIVEVEHFKYEQSSVSSSVNGMNVNISVDEKLVLDMIKDGLDLFNQKKILDCESNDIIRVYANKINLSILEENRKRDIISNYEETISELEILYRTVSERNFEMESFLKGLPNV